MKKILLVFVLVIFTIYVFNVIMYNSVREVKISPSVLLEKPKGCSFVTAGSSIREVVQAYNLQCEFEGVEVTVGITSYKSESFDDVSDVNKEIGESINNIYINSFNDNINRIYEAFESDKEAEKFIVSYTDIAFESFNTFEEGGKSWGRYSGVGSVYSLDIVYVIDGEYVISISKYEPIDSKDKSYDVKEFIKYLKFDNIELGQGLG